MKKSSFLQFVLLLTLFGCSSDDSAEEAKDLNKAVTILATIVETGGGPCSFLIQPDEAPETFLRGEIPKRFQEDGFRVEVTYQSEGTMFSCSGFLNATEIEVLEMGIGLWIN